MADTHLTPEAAGFALIKAHRAGTTKLSRKAGSFAGELIVDQSSPLSPKQVDWLAALLSKAGLPPLAGDGL